MCVIVFLKLRLDTFWASRQASIKPLPSPHQAPPNALDQSLSTAIDIHDRVYNAQN